MAKTAKKPRSTRKATGLGRLTALGITHPAGILLYLPTRYQNYTRPETKLRPYVDGKRTYFQLEVVGKPREYTDRRPHRVVVPVREVGGLDDSPKNLINRAEAGLVAFGETYPWNTLVAGRRIHLTAHVRTWNGTLQIANPEWVGPEKQGCVVPRYTGKPKVITPETVANKISEAFDLYLDDTVRHLCEQFALTEAEIIEQSGIPYPDLETLLRSLHQPGTPDEVSLARQAAVRLSAFHVFHTSRRSQQRLFVPRSSVPVESDIDAWIGHVPFELTGDQRKAIDEVLSDLHSPYPMNRLLSGDVGVGKTLCYLLPAVAANAEGASVVILMPSQLLARQVHRELSEFFPGTHTFLVEAGKRTSAQALRDGNPILVGTQAILHAAKKHLPNWKPDLLIIDEQHKLGRAQREQLVDRHTNILEATATAIPRTAALATHTSMDVSILRESPVDKQVATRIVTADKRREMFAFLKQQVEQGHQVAAIYPRVEEDSKTSPESAETKDRRAQPAPTRHSLAEVMDFWEKHFPGRVCVLYGGMSNEQKTSMLNAMKEGRYSVLVSSTVVEIGVTVPNLKAVAVQQADRFGMSTLHQIRGRVARTGGKGYCFLYVPDEVSEEAMKRLQAVESTNDGFKLAELDMEQRGFGNLSLDGEEQTGNLAGLFPSIKVKPSDLKPFGERSIQPAPALAPNQSTGAQSPADGPERATAPKPVRRDDDEWQLTLI